MSHSTYLELDLNKLEEDDETKTVWNIYVNRDSMLVVDFGREVTAEDAITAFFNEEYLDILDEEDLAVLEVIDII